MGSNWAAFVPYDMIRTAVGTGYDRYFSASTNALPRQPFVQLRLHLRMLRKAVVKCPKTQSIGGLNVRLQVVDIERAGRVEIELGDGLVENLLPRFRAAG
jgi:hypothetical protein